MVDDEVNSDVVDVIIEVVKCFGVMLSPHDEVQALQETIIGLLDNQKATSAVRKKAVIALSILAVYMSDEQLIAFIKRAVTVLQSSKTDAVTQRLYLTIMGSMARSIPHRFGQHIESVVQLTMSALSEESLQSHLEEVGGGDDIGTDFAEVREAALVALEAFLASCPLEMRPYTDEAIAACLRFVKYDPNYATNDEDEEMEEDDDEDEDEDDDFGDDDEYEAGGGFDDDDDASWKVRRCAAKALHTLVSTRSNGDLLDSGVLYARVALPLVKRFDEREDNVRLDVISAVSLLIRKTGVGIVPEFTLDATQGDGQAQQPPSRKRRRQSSSGNNIADASGIMSPMQDTVPPSGPRADLARLTPQIVKSSIKLLKGKSIATKQATMNLLDDLTLVQRGGLSDYLDQILDLVVDAVKTTAASASASLSGGSGAASATPSTLRITALKFLSDIARTHSSSLLQSHLPKIVSGVVGAVNERFYKISSQAIETAEEVGKAITPPRSRMTAQKYKGELVKVYDVVLERASAVDADAEVRQKAIRALGTLLARTSDGEGASLLAADKRSSGLSTILDRLKNETTRLAAVKAVDDIATHPSPNFDGAWAQQVAKELSAQLRKANRVLRNTSIHALKDLMLASGVQESIDQDIKQTVVDALLPIMANNDAQLLGSALRILGGLVRNDTENVVTPKITTAVCDLVQLNVVAATLNPLLDLVAQIGQTGQGEPLMVGLLQIGVSGDPATVGKVIGTLLVASGGTGVVDINSFVKEAETSTDDAKRGLALSVLGEAALRLGVNSPLKPELFLQHFVEEYDKLSMTAAMSLGHAAAGNPQLYLPVILDNFKKASAKEYLLLQAIKEMLLQNADISQSADTVWKCLLKASANEDNKAVCAECLGRLAIVDPEAFIPRLDVSFHEVPFS